MELPSRQASARHAVAALLLAVAFFVLAAALTEGRAPFWASATLGELAFLAGALLAVASGGLNGREALSLGLPRPVPALVALVSAASLTVFLGEVAPLVQALFERLGLGFEKEVEEYSRRIEGELRAAPALTAAVLVLLPAVCEEALFRGIALRGFARSLGRWPALLLTSMLFGLVHVLPVRIVITSLLGAFFALTVFWTGSLWCAVLAHALNNALAVVIGEHEGLRPLVAVPALAVFALTAAVLHVRSRRGDRDDHGAVEPPSGRRE